MTNYIDAHKETQCLKDKFYCSKHGPAFQIFPALQKQRSILCSKNLKPKEILNTENLIAQFDFKTVNFNKTRKVSPPIKGMQSCLKIVQPEAIFKQ